MLLHMRTTLELPDALWREAKQRAAKQGITLTTLVDDALRTYLRLPNGAGRRRFRWTVEHGTLLPGVDVDSRQKLYELLGGRGD